MQIRSLSLLLATMMAFGIGVCAAEERTQNFDVDPHWDGHNNRAQSPPPRTVRQDFGYSPTRHAGGASAGELGGMITPAAEPAYYAKRIKPASLKERLMASGKLACTGGQFHMLVGFFNAGSINEWRTPNSIVLRLYGRGNVFYAYVEYATSRWRAGGDSPGGFATVADPRTGKRNLRGFVARGAPHTWSLTYDPNANGGNGSIIATIDNEKAICHLDPGHKQDGAVFNRCGLLSIPKHFDQGGEVWLDDITINGQFEDFQTDPRWDAVGNRRNYTTYSVRPRFDFGFSPTQYAGGKVPGELGGVIFRGDIRYSNKMAYYADRLESLKLDKPLHAAGKIAMRRGITDSTSLIGFFHSKDSIAVVDSQASGIPMNFLGVAIEGPSSQGFFAYPVYRFSNGAEGHAARHANLPHIMPDGRSADWSFDYDPQSSGRSGRLTLKFDGRLVQLDLARGQRGAPARFDRFGIVTTWIDGNAQHLYFDDLTYTFRQE